MVHALEAVLAEVDADRIVFGGDVVAGPFPRETLALVRSVDDALYVRGNAEREPQGWLLERLAAEDVECMRGWPATVELDDVLYCHATPRSDEEIVTDATTDDKIQSFLAGVGARLVVGGHTHMQQRRGRYVNAGSVGMPYEGEVAAFWLLVDDGEPAFRKTSFDVDAVARAVEASGWPDAGSFVRENLRGAPTREDAIGVFGG
jgi:predicted phosphodiesterase